MGSSSEETRRKSGSTLAEKVWDQHVVRTARAEPDLLYIDLHLVHEVTSPQAFDGLRARRPARAAPRPHHRHRGPQRPDARHPRAHRRPGLPHAGRDAAAQRRGVRRQALPDGRRQPGHRPHDRPGAGAHPAGHDGRLRRLATPPPTARSVRWRSASARPRSSTSWPPRRCRCGRSRRWRSTSTAAAARRHQQGRHPRGDRPDRHRRRAGLRARVPRRGHRELSMEARMTICNMSIEAGGRAGHGRPGRDDVRLPDGPPARPAGRPWDAAVEYWRELRTDDDAEFDAVVHIDADALTPFVTWGTNPGQGLPLSEAVPDPEGMSDDDAAAARQGARLHGPRARHPAPRHRRRHRLPRLVHQRAHRGPARGRRRPARASTSPTTCRCSSSPARCRSRRRPRPRASTGVHRGRRRVALRGLLDVPGHEPRPARARSSAARRRRTATSRAGRARAGARTWCRRWSRRPPRRGTCPRRGPHAAPR